MTFDFSKLKVPTREEALAALEPQPHPHVTWTAAHPPWYDPRDDREAALGYDLPIPRSPWRG